MSMGYVITVALLKGGVGKTTTAVALAETAALGAPCTLIDADPMGSAYRWSRIAAASSTPLRATVAPTDADDLTRHPEHLGRVIAAASRSAGVVIVDAPPPGALALGRASIEAADVLVMPTTPNAADLDRIPATRQIAADHGIPAYALLSMVRGGLMDRLAALTALLKWSVPVLTTELPLTVSVQRNYGQPVTGVLSRYGLDLMTELLRRREADSNERAS